MKACTKCNEQKEESEFYLNRGKLTSQCKECIRKKSREYGKKNKEKVNNNKRIYYKKNKKRLLTYRKEWYIKNRDKQLKKFKEYREKNKDIINKQKREWVEKNREHVKNYKKEYYQKNKDEIRKKRKGYEKERSKIDIQYKLRRNFSRDIHIALKYGKIISSLIETIDYTMDELKQYIENQFSENMSWENHGDFWHIDHIIPKSLYDFTNKNEIKKCWNLRNLRPLEKEENMSKNNTINLILIEERKIEDLLPSNS